MTHKEFQQWLIDNAAADPYEALADWDGDYESDAELFFEED